jgi:hypothetical protein
LSSRPLTQAILRPKKSDSPDEGKINLDPAKLFLHNGEWKHCFRKNPRIDLSANEHPVSIHFHEICPDLFPLQTLSETGMSFNPGQYDFGELSRRDLVARVQIGRKHFDLAVKVVLVKKGAVALEMVNPPPALRDTIRAQFKAEFLAVSLQPFHSYSGMFAGATHTLIYSDGCGNTLQLAMKESSMEGLFAELRHFGARLKWSAQEPFCATSLATGKPLQYEIRRMIISFIRNLPDLPLQLVQTIESLLERGLPPGEL